MRMGHYYMWKAVLTMTMNDKVSEDDVFVVTSTNAHRLMFVHSNAENSSMDPKLSSKGTILSTWMYSATSNC